MVGNILKKLGILKEEPKKEEPKKEYPHFIPPAYIGQETRVLFKLKGGVFMIGYLQEKTKEEFKVEYRGRLYELSALEHLEKI